MDDDVYAPSVDYNNLPNTPGVKHPQGIGAHIVDFIQTLVVFGAIFAIIYLFIAQPHKVSGTSMVPTFHHGDYILTDKISYRFNKPKRGDVIVLKNPRDESQDFIKRIIGLPGDTVRVENDRVYVNGNLLEEKYLPAGRPTAAGSFFHEGEDIKVAQDHYIVFGDNREHSSDSREWGPITSEEIIGRVFFRYWPLNSFGII